MATQVGLDHTAVIEAAAAIADRDGLDALTLSALAARLGIRSQSLYAHVDGLDGLQRDLALHAVQLLGEELRAAAIGRSGRGALEAIADTYVAFATRHPGLYAATIRNATGDTELLAANQRAGDALGRILESFGLEGDDNVHAHRAIWSAIHGFITLSHAGAFSRPASTDETYRRTIAMFADALEARG